MAVTVEDLEKRLEVLEREVSDLKKLWLVSDLAESADRGARLLREAEQGQAVIETSFARALTEMGIKGTPIGAEKLQERLVAAGWRPEENALSRGIIDMREE